MTIRNKIEEIFENILQNASSKRIEGLVRSDAYGHEAGMPVENWVKGHLDNIDWGSQSVTTFFPNEFLRETWERIGRNKTRILNFSEEIWWGPLLVSKKQVNNFVNRRPVTRYQQEGADIVLFYGDDIFENSEDVILLNVKSHDSSKQSRPPNIMSAQRLLQFFSWLLKKPRFPDLIGKVNLWFLGVSYLVTSSVANANGVHIRDLFKLDLDQLPQINFDAAIQIQWHVKDMVEKGQTKLEFMESLADTFIEQWENHSSRKNEKYERLVRTIKESISARNNG